MYNKDTVKEELNEYAGKSRKEKRCYIMTNAEIKLILRLIAEVIKSSESKDEAVKKIEALLK